MLYSRGGHALIQDHDCWLVIRDHPHQGGNGRLRVQKGDILYLTEAPGGGYRLTPHDPEFARQMAHAEEIMHDDREVLRALAK